MAEITRTITEQINFGKALEMTDCSMRKQCIVDLSDGNYLLMNLDSVFSRYKKQLKKNYVTKYAITATDAIKYNYKPTYLSYVLYGTIEMAPFILEINNMVSATEFTNLEDGLYLFNRNIRTFLNEVLNKEEFNIQNNRDEIDQELLTIQSN